MRILPNFIFSCFDIDDVIQNASLTIKENIYYLGEGVNLQRMTESAREHFDYLQEQHERSASEEELKVCLSVKINYYQIILASCNNYLTRQN